MFKGVTLHVVFCCCGVTHLSVQACLRYLQPVCQLLELIMFLQMCLHNSLTVYGSVMQAIYVPADDLTDPAPATTFAHLDATTVLSRSIAELGIYPAVDPLDSTSRMLSARILGQEHYDTARGVQRVLQVHCIFDPCIHVEFV